ncbi:hypothetical protein JCM10207_008209 [Rhodosporidiobolus poonsookiae]
MASSSASSTTGASQTSSDRPSHHVVHPITGTLSFRNPWPSASAPTPSELLFGGAWLGWPKLHLHHHPKARELQVLEPNWGTDKVRELKQKAKEQGKDKAGFMRGTWLGHATAFVELPIGVPEDPWKAAKRKAQGEKGEVDEPEEMTVKLLFDPIFSERAGPTSYTGPGRIKPAPCKVEDLPGVDAVFVSHNHYDHLDHGSVKSVMAKWPRAKYFVPLGNKEWLFATGVPLSQIYELDWWEEVNLSPSDFGLAPAPLPSPPLPSDPGSESGEKRRTPSRARSYSFRDEPANRETERVRITCVPAQHNSGRSPTDQASTLWSGWIVERLVETDPPPEPPSSSAASLRPSPLGRNSSARSSSSASSPASDPVSQQVISETVHEEPEEQEPGADSSLAMLDEDAVLDEDDDDDAASVDSRLHVTPPSGTNSRSISPASSTVSVPLDPPPALLAVPGIVSASSPSLPLENLDAGSTTSASSSRRRRSSVRDVLQRSSSFSKNVARRLSGSSNTSTGSAGSARRSPSRGPGGRGRKSSLSVVQQQHEASPLSRSSSLRAARERARTAAEEAEAGVKAEGGEETPMQKEERERADALSEAMGAVHVREASPSPGASIGEGSSSEEEGLKMPGGLEVVRQNSPPAGQGVEVKEVDLNGKEARRLALKGRVTRKGAIYHAGDTGYRRHRRAPEPVCPAFDELGRKYGPFDLSYVPIWRGGTLGFVSAIGLRLHHENISSALHGSPTDAVDIHLDVRSRNTIGMHFGTFIGSESEAYEAIIELHEACEEAGVKDLDDPNEDELGRMGVTDFGETWVVEIQDMLIVAS